MKKVGILLLFFAFIHTAFAQVVKPVKWNSRVETGGANEFTLVITGAIDEGWHVYSQYTDENGSLPMIVKFNGAGKDFQLIGKTTESKTIKKYSDVFEVTETFFEHNLVLRQKIKTLKPGLSNVTAVVDYQVCQESCINDKEKFTFNLPATANSTATAPATSSTLTEVPTAIETGKAQVAEDTSSSASTPDVKSVAATEKPQEKDNKSLWTIFILSFLGGFAALLTPCVFPLIPMTVSFFTKQSKNRAKGIRNALLYGISIIVIYVLLGTLITAIFGADALNALSTNVYFNLAFFVILVVFAISFLGAFEIVLPHSWANRIDRQAEKGGLMGILFMALALAIVSFSCTGPIVGDLLFASAAHGGIGPIVGMFGFSLALALPFMLFAVFPGWLQSLPRSGGWLNTVKVFLGFLELAFAFKFLSNADLVLQTHLLEREVFITIWIAVFGALTLYLFGAIKTPHDSPVAHLSVGRLLLATLSLAFTLYLIPGLWGAPLKIINAYPPPLEYSESPRGIGKAAETSNSPTSLPKGAEVGPHDIPVFHDYEAGLAYAKTSGKPIMLDFTGWACVNCRKMENEVWSQPEILPILKNQVVVISLYVDDRRPLPASELGKLNFDGDPIETIGEKWTDFMIRRYKTNTQPLYVLTDHEGNNLNTADPTKSYVSKEEYLKWLNTGISHFKK